MTVVLAHSICNTAQQALAAFKRHPLDQKQETPDEPSGRGSTARPGEILEAHACSGSTHYRYNTDTEVTWGEYRHKE
jgi:hypothetical protein